MELVVLRGQVVQRAAIQPFAGELGDHRSEAPSATARQTLGGQEHVVVDVYGGAHASDASTSREIPATMSGTDRFSVSMWVANRGDCNALAQRRTRCKAHRVAQGAERRHRSRRRMVVGLAAKVKWCTATPSRRKRPTVSSKYAGSTTVIGTTSGRGWSRSRLSIVATVKRRQDGMSWKSQVLSAAGMILRSIRPMSSGSTIRAPGSSAARARATVVFPTPNAPFSQITQPPGIGIPDTRTDHDRMKSRVMFPRQRHGYGGRRLASQASQGLRFADGCRQDPAAGCPCAVAPRTAGRAAPAIVTPTS